MHLWVHCALCRILLLVHLIANLQPKSGWTAQAMTTAGASLATSGLRGCDFNCTAGDDLEIHRSHASRRSPTRPGSGGIEHYLTRNRTAFDSRAQARHVDLHCDGSQALCATAGRAAQPVADHVSKPPPPPGCPQPAMVGLFVSHSGSVRPPLFTRKQATGTNAEASSRLLPARTSQGARCTLRDPLRPEHRRPQLRMPSTRFRVGLPLPRVSGLGSSPACVSHASMSGDASPCACS